MRNKPTAEQQDALVGLCNEGRYARAEPVARAMTVHFPLHGFGWKVLGVALKQLGRGEESLEPLRKAVALMPSDADSHMNLAASLQQSGRLAEAEACFTDALGIRPDFAEAHYCLGNVLRDLGRMHEAEHSYRRALQHNPDFVEAHGNLAYLLQQSGRLVEAEAGFRRALQITPDDAEAHYNLGIILRERGLRDQAMACCEQALEIDPNFVDARCNLASMLNEIGRPAEAVAQYRKVLVDSPSQVSARLGISTTLSRIVPHWHVPMMNDARRNQAYFAALAAVVTPDSEVFEIGTGSGLVAMMAAKLGARQVTTCEAVPLIAETALRIVADNGYEQSITVLAKQSADVIVGQDLARKADILVAEIFSSELLGEQVLPSIEDARQRLLRDGGRVLPAAGSIMIALIGGGELTRNVVVEDSFGFNLQRFNGIISEKQVIARTDLDVEMLSGDVEAFRFEFQRDASFPGETRQLSIPITAAGRCYGIIQWIRLQMDENVRFENHPGEDSPVSNWQHCTYVFAQPIDVRPGQVALISASHNRIVPWFCLDRIQDS